MNRIVVLATLSILWAAGSAEAVNNTLNNAIPTALGQVRSQTIAGSDVAYFGYTVSPDRSYAGFCWLSSIENAILGSGWCHLTLRDLSDVVLSNESQSAEPNPRSGASVTYTPGTTSVFARVVNTIGSPQTVNFVMVETTLASPWYFVAPASGYDAFVEIRNQSTTAVNATVRAYSAAGTVAGSTTVSVPGNGNTAVSVASLGVATGSGSLTLTHNAMPGSVVANTTTLSAMTGLSFDSPFTSRMAWSLFP